MLASNDRISCSRYSVHLSPHVVCMVLVHVVCIAPRSSIEYMQSDVHVELTRSATATSTVLMVVDSMEYLMEYLMELIIWWSRSSVSSSSSSVLRRSLPHYM